MLNSADDMHVFYDPDVFGTQCARRRPDEADVPFVALKGVVDELALEGYALTARHALRYPTAAVELIEGDRVVVGCDRDDDGAVILVNGAVQGGELCRVLREPRRTNDGAEATTLLSAGVVTP